MIISLTLVTLAMHARRRKIDGKKGVIISMHIAMSFSISATSLQERGTERDRECVCACNDSIDIN